MLPSVTPEPGGTGKRRHPVRATLTGKDGRNLFNLRLCKVSELQFACRGSIAIKEIPVNGRRECLRHCIYVNERSSEDVSRQKTHFSHAFFSFYETLHFLGKLRTLVDGEGGGGGGRLHRKINLQNGENPACYSISLVNYIFRTGAPRVPHPGFPRG